jgi:hypothetical protein
MSTVKTNTIGSRGGLLGISGGLSVLSTMSVGGAVSVNGLTTLTGTLAVTGASIIPQLVCSGVFDATAATQITTGIVTCATELPATGNEMATKAYVDFQAIGVGQTWAAFTTGAGNAREKNTAYQNNTGKPIMVMVVFSSDPAGSLTNQPNVWCDASNPPTTLIQHYTCVNEPHAYSFIVPNQFFYKANWGSNGQWAELR